MTRLTAKTGILLLLLPLAACTKKAPTEPEQHRALHALQIKMVSELRQIEAVRAFAVLHEKGQLASIAIGEFIWHERAEQSLQKPDSVFHYTAYGRQPEFIVNYGRLEIKWSAFPLSKSAGEFLIKTDVPLMEVTGVAGQTFPSTFTSFRFTAIFPITTPSDRQSGTSGFIDRDNLVVYELPPDWTEDAIAMLASKNAPNLTIEHTSPFSAVLIFLRELRAAEADPVRAGIPLQQLNDLVERRGDPQLIDTLLYLALHPETKNPFAEDYWKLFIAGLKNGFIPKSSGVRLEKALNIFSGLGLPEAKEAEIRPLLRNHPLGRQVFRDGISSLSDEDQRFWVMLYMNYYVPPQEGRQRLNWPTLAH